MRGTSGVGCGFPCGLWSQATKGTAQPLGAGSGAEVYIRKSLGKRSTGFDSCSNPLVFQLQVFGLFHATSWNLDGSNTWCASIGMFRGLPCFF